MSSTSSAPPVRRGFFTTPSWSRSAVAMSLLLGAGGLVSGSLFVVLALRSVGSLDVAILAAGVLCLLTGPAALATGLRGVRAWQHDQPIPNGWYWPGMAACVVQGTGIAGWAVYSYFLSGGPIAGLPAWVILLVIIGGGGIPYLGALCCGGAWWVGRERPDGEVAPELQ